MSEDEKDQRLGIETVPPPDGADDAYNAPTRVGAMSESLLQEIQRYQERDAAEAPRVVAGDPDDQKTARPPAGAGAAPRPSPPSKPLRIPTALGQANESESVLTDEDLIVENPAQLHNADGRDGWPRQVTAPLPWEPANAPHPAAAAARAAEAPAFPAVPAPAPPAFNFVPLVVGMTIFVVGLLVYFYAR